MKNKKVILSSILSLLLCASLIVGGTFALFTSEAKTNIAVTSGKVEVVAEVTDLKLYSHKDINIDTKVGEKLDMDGNLFLTGGTANYEDGTLTLDKIVPGDGVTFNISVTNNSNVAIKYRTVISAPVGDTQLMEALAVTINSKNYTGLVKGAWTSLEANGKIDAIPVSIELPTTAGDEYQGKTVNVSVTVEAVQGNAVEHIDVYDPDNTDEVTLDNVIDSAAEFVAFANAVNEGNTYAGETVTLATSIDLNGAAWTAMSNFAGTFDGQGYTVSNLTANLFGTVSGTVKNLNVEDVNVLNTAKNGANGFIGTVDVGGLVDNCKVSDVAITWDAGKGTTDCWGGIINRVNTGATVQNCEISNVTITADNYVKRSAAVFAEVGGKISGCTVGGVTLNVLNDDKATGDAYTSQVGGIIADLYSGAEVSDCIFNNVTLVIDDATNTGGIIGKAYVTGISGTHEITLKNITVNVLTMNIGNTVQAQWSTVSNVGGFIGQVDSRNNDAHLTMDNCHIKNLDMTLESNIKGEDPAGGLISSINAGVDISNCSVNGKIDGTNTVMGIGGFLGEIGGYGANNLEGQQNAGKTYIVNITDCSANVEITGNDSIVVGGFVSYAGSESYDIDLKLNFTNCEANGSFYGVRDTGTNEVITFIGCKVDGADFAG